MYIKGFKFNTGIQYAGYDISVNLNPWINILPPNIQPQEQALIYEKEESLGYATALGLALRGVKKND